MSLSEPDVDPRTDLPWLRHRALPRTAPASASTPVRPAAASTSLDLNAPTTPTAPAPAAGALNPGTPAPATTSLDLGASTTPTTTLDLGAPPAQPPTAPATAPIPAASGNLLDLSAPASPAVPAPAAPQAPASVPAPAPAPASGSNLLDLSAPPTPTPAAAGRPVPKRKTAAAGDLVLGWEPDGVTPGQATVLTPRDPVVALTGVQSGIGTLTLAANLPAHLAGLRVMAAYELADGTRGVLDEATGLRTAPGSGPRPVVTANADHSRALVIDLLQVRDLSRMVVLVADPAAGALTWSGALSVTTLSGARTSVPLERDTGAGVLVALSIHQVDGHLVLRAESELVPGTLRDACDRYGITDLAWVDPWTPLT